MLTTFLAATLLVSGCALGALLVGLWMRSRIVELDAARKLAEVNAASVQTTPAKMAETFQALADTALRSNQQSFIESARSTLETVRVEMTGDLTERQTAVETVVKPLAASLVRLENQISELESARQRAFGGFEQQLQAMTQRELELQKETAALVTALRAPNVRGRWGELTLRRVAELAGMAERCDFFEQETQETDNGRIRPDMIVRLPGNRTIVVDAKAPLTAYLDAVAASSDADRRNALLRHSQQVAKHVDQLSSKTYWAQFQPAPEFVVLFLPGDPFFSAALEHKPALVEDAARQKILVATPTTLIAILKGVAYGWRQEKLAENAEEIRQLAAELFDRIVTLQTHFNEIGRSLGKSVEAFNRCVGSLESRLYPSLRRIRELGATTAEEPPAPERVDVVPRTPGLFETS
jgi:DNA recombination protein RmuC